MKTEEALKNTTLGRVEQWKRDGFTVVGNSNGTVVFGKKMIALLDTMPIDDAIALLQPKPPLTWNDAINAMSAEEKGAFFATFDCPLSLNLDWCDIPENCQTCMTAFFNSPCDGGKREGAGE